MLNFFRALNNHAVTHTPVWFMRQAGRYLPEYRQLREHAGSFLALCKTPNLAVEATLQPLRRFKLDAAIMFSDILVIPDALGMKLDFVEGTGPVFSDSIDHIESINKLDISNLEEKLSYVSQIIMQVQTELAGLIPLIGFSGSPFTLACYMLEGGSSRDYTQVKHWLYTKPELLHVLLKKLTQAVIRYLHMQIEAGVNVLMLFDSLGGILSLQQYEEFSLAYINEIITAVHNMPTRQANDGATPCIVFTKGGGGWLHRLIASNPDVISLDLATDIVIARQQIPKHIAIQGNLDPVLLALGDKAALKQEVKRILASYKIANHGSSSGHIFNLAHGVLPDTNPDSVRYVVDLVHELSA